MGELYAVTPEGKYEKIANVVGSYLTDGGAIIVRPAEFRRIAKRKNRLRRWNNWKKRAAERARLYNLPLAEKYRYLVDAVKNHIIDTVTDCVGIIKGMEWGGYRHE